MPITTWAVILRLFSSPIEIETILKCTRGKKYAGAVFMHILIIVKPIALAYKKVEGSTQAQSTITSIRCYWGE